MKAQRTYWLGFSHDLSHDEYVSIGKAVGSRVTSAVELTPREQAAVATIEDGSPVWIRPAFDGLRVFVSKEGAVSDEEYS